MSHEVVVEIVREHPESVLDLLRGAFGIETAGTVELVGATENLTEVQPTERRADAVIIVRRPGRRRALRAIVVEVQLSRDRRKRWSWPAYVAVLRARLSCPVSLLVISLDAATARWCMRPIALDDHGSRLCALVIGPDQLPSVDVDLARRRPELAILWLLAHPSAPSAVALSRAVLEACDGLDDARSSLYADLVLTSLDDVARAALEAEMDLKHYEMRSPFLRKLVAGGAVDGRVAALFKVLEARGFAVDAECRRTIEDCRNVEQIDAWLVLAATATSVDDVFAR